MAGVKDLELWQEAMTLSAEVVRAARHSMRKERNTFLERLISTASALPESIAAGYALSEPLERHRVFQASARSISSLETQLAVARIADLIPGPAVTSMLNRAAAVGRLLTIHIACIEPTGAGRDTKARFSAATAASPLSKTLDEIHCA